MAQFAAESVVHFAAESVVHFAAELVAQFAAESVAQFEWNIQLVNGNQTIRIRMEGIDAPERGMPFYKKAKNYLGDLCFEQEITVKITGKDKYKRILAYSYLNDGRELGQEMIKAGLAWHYKKYNSNKTLSKLEQEAKDNKRGLWIYENPMAPWTNRSLHRQGISTKDSFNIKVDEK